MLILYYKAKHYLSNFTHLMSNMMSTQLLREIESILCIIRIILVPVDSKIVTIASVAAPLPASSG